MDEQIDLLRKENSKISLELQQMKESQNALPESATQLYDEVNEMI
jgi:uncharacterized coiled-coil DUF342 family protein